MPEGWVAYLIDETEGVSVNLAEKTQLTYQTEKLPCRTTAIEADRGDPRVVESASDVPLTPMAFELLPNFPNPFNPETRIQYTLPKNGQVHLAVYNMLGQRVRMLVSEKQKAGLREMTWHGMADKRDRVPSGIYFMKLEFENRVLVRKMVMVK